MTKVYREDTEEKRELEATRKHDLAMARLNSSKVTWEVLLTAIGITFGASWLVLGMTYHDYGMAKGEMKCMKRAEKVK